MRYITLISFLFLALPAQAAMLCTFTAECLEGEACAETSYTAERSTDKTAPLTLTTDAETLEGQMIASDDNLHFVFAGATAAHLLTEYPDGGARYTIHMDGPFTITYHGSCEEKP